MATTSPTASAWRSSGAPTRPCGGSSRSRWGWSASRSCRTAPRSRSSEWLPGIADRHPARLLRPHRAGHRVGRRQPQTRATRDGDDYVLNGVQDLHHQRHLGRRLPGVRADRRGGAQGRLGLPGPHRHPRLRPHRDQGQARPARPGHRRDVLRRRARAGERDARRRGGGVQDRDAVAGQGPRLGRRGLRRASSRAASRRSSPTAPSAASSAARWPRSSWSRTWSPTSPSTPTRRGCSPGGRPT